MPRTSSPGTAASLSSMELLIWLMSAAVVVAAAVTGVMAWMRSRRRVAAGIPSRGTASPIRDGLSNGLIALVIFAAFAVLVVWIASIFL